jgi:signal transduction histidine kinase
LPSDNQSAPATTTTHPLSESGPIHILVVEDDAVDRIAIRRTLRRYGEGVHLQEAGGTVEARVALAAGRFDCALLDQQLPDGDGMDLVREIASCKYKTAVVILTGVDDEAAALRALSEGADDYLVKGRIDDYALLRSVRYATERRRSETLRAQLRHMDRLAALGTLAAGVAHEINNPLACIIGNLSAIGSTPEKLSAFLGTGPDQLSNLIDLGQMMDDCLTAAQRVAAIVKDLRNLARSDDHPLTRVSLETMLDSAANIAATQVRPRAELVKAYGQSPSISANAQGLVQVFVNLIINAAQAIAKGSPGDNEVRITTHTDPAGRAVAEISDTGCGIRQEDRGRLFEPFFTTKDVGEGTGLGLSICWGIVTSLGGEITWEPRQGGRGTTFRVCLPAASQRREGAEQEPGPRRAYRPLFKKEIKSPS